MIVNYIFILDKNTRKQAGCILRTGPLFSIPELIFFCVLLIMTFRNLYFMVNVDSQSTYLFTQKLWLSSGSSLIGGIANDFRIFVPHFDFVPASLGISLFGNETLFPQLLNLFWRLIALFLVFGYVSYRFGRYYGLAACMLVAFDEHFFYSGVNHWVLINGALIAFLFAAAYNFWEARNNGNYFRLALGLIFLSQLLANKYQMAFVFLFILMLGALVQHNFFKVIQGVFNNKRYVISIVASFFIMSLWFLKNILIVGDPVFPILADKFHVFGWTSDMVGVFVKVFGGLTLSKFIKYMSYLFTWPGISAAKYAIIIISFLPLILILGIKKRVKDDMLLELCYWLGMSVLILMGICFFCHQDPRYYRYPICIMAFAVIFSGLLIFRECFKINDRLIYLAMILVFVLPGLKVIKEGGVNLERPTLRENADVLFNKIHMDEAIRKHYPYIPKVLEGIKNEEGRFKVAAWDAGTGCNFPAFLLPIRPVLSLWYTNIIKWESYNSEAAIISDLKKHEISWVLTVTDGELFFMEPAEYAKVAVKYDRYPRKIYFDYGFPPELSNVSY